MQIRGLRKYLFLRISSLIIFVALVVWCIHFVDFEILNLIFKKGFFPCCWWAMFEFSIFSVFFAGLCYLIFIFEVIIRFIFKLISKKEEKKVLKSRTKFEKFINSIYIIFFFINLLIFPFFLFYLFLISVA